MTKTAKMSVALLASVLLAGCGLFGDDDELEPAELVKFEQTLKIKKSWSAKLGDEAEFLRLALQPAGDGNRIYGASADGKVTAFDPETGKRQWQVKLGTGLSAGPAAGDGLVVVVAADGQVIALDAQDGSERWRNEGGVEALSKPVIGSELVLVQSVDSRLRALEVFDGSERWSVEQTVPALTMRGGSSPVVVGPNVVAGFDNGKLVSVGTDSGDVTWESYLAPPTGRTDLERLSDIDGSISVVGQDIYAAGYQGRLASLAAESGQVLWVSDISSYEGVSADWNSVYTVQDGGVVIAMTRRNGAEIWRQDSLLRREPTLPVPFHTTVVTGDLEGYLHFFSNIDGDAVARVRFGKAAISSDPVVVGNRLYVQSDSGSIAAFEVDEGRKRRRAPDIAEDGA